MRAMLLPALLALATAPAAQDPVDTQRVIDEVGIDQRLGERLPLGATFRNQDGERCLIGLSHGVFIDGP